MPKRFITLPNSPTHRTMEVDKMTHTQEEKESGVVLNTSPPNVTINTCPIKMTTAVTTKPMLLCS